MSWLRYLLFSVCLLVFSQQGDAHELDPGYLDIRETEAGVFSVFWRKPDVRNVPMDIHVQLPTSCTPSTGPVPVSDGAAWHSQWTALCPAGLQGEVIEIVGLSRQNTDVLVRFQPVEGAPSTSRLTATQPQFAIPISQSHLQVGWTYAVLGFEHILEGWDHLLFVFALVLLIRSKGRLVGAITAFTVAHSITLALAALGHVSIPGPPVEAIIALSVVFLAIEILKRDDMHLRLSERAPWVVAFCFGLLHGLGFAGALQDIGLPDVDIALALLTFNLGVEAGQLVFVAVILFLNFGLKTLLKTMNLLSYQLVSRANAVAGYTIGGIATFWLAERIYGF
ncbi:HupE/UreJ family protein [uncultured Shimia sp.]|uniref:HupE/UreJ family protein n=1 Tax=uncultured Shimia sp. TaxID=573152 RepID=UPI002617B3A3|nr:HupE/UreJ family protein [uncultured Shimia sp.]